MDEFIREVDEEYRRHRLAQFCERYGIVVVGLAVLLVAGVGGWRYWQHVETKRSEIAAVKYDDAVQLSRDQKSAESEKALETLAADAPSGYRQLARFRLAAELGLADATAGAKAYDDLAKDGSVDAGLQGLARLRAASLRIGAPETAAAAQRELEGMATPGNPWRHSARELLGLAAMKRGDLDGASRWFDQIAADRNTPPNLRGRLEVYSALVAGGPVQSTQ